MEKSIDHRPCIQTNSIIDPFDATTESIVNTAIIIIIAAFILNRNHVLPSPNPKSVPKSCFDNDRLCFETSDLSTGLDPSTFELGLDKLCPPGKTLPQIFGEVEQKALQEFLATLPRDIEYLALIGLKIGYRRWAEVIKAGTDNLSDKNYLVMKLKKDSLVLQAEDASAKHPFVCAAKVPCPCQSSRTPDSLCLSLDSCCLRINTCNNNDNNLNYYDAVNYCRSRFNASLLTHSILNSNDQKIRTNLPANLQELWAAEMRVDLSWLSGEPAIYTHWQPGYPKEGARYAYLKYDSKDGSWMTLQDDDLSSDDDDDDDEKIIAVCVSEEKAAGMEKPNIKPGQEVPGDKSTIKYAGDSINNNNNNNNATSSHNNNKQFKIGLGIGLGLCLFLLVSVVAAVIVVCLRRQKRRHPPKPGQGGLGKTPSVGTISTSLGSTSSRQMGSQQSLNAYNNNYIAMDNNNNPSGNNKIIPTDNYVFGSRTTRDRVYEDIRPYEVPDMTPVVEHVYKAARNHPSAPATCRRQLPQLPERPSTLPQLQPRLEMMSHSYLEIIE